MRVILLPQALRRLDEIFDWVSTSNSKEAAARVYNAILDELEILERQPKIAAIETILADLPQQFRSLVINRKYKAVYYIEEAEETVFVATVWDCRRNPENMKLEI
jgi:plasmid stabilization system protein ParE